MEMGVDTTTGNETNRGAPLAAAFPRHEQTFPALTPQEIARMRRFGELRSYKHGETLFETGKPGPGMFVVLSGHVAITLRDGLGHVTPVIEQGAGQCRDIANSAGPVARAADGRSRSRRTHHARAGPAPRQPDPGRRRRPGADR